MNLDTFPIQEVRPVDRDRAGLYSRLERVVHGQRRWLRPFAVGEAIKPWEALSESADEVGRLAQLKACD